MSDRHALGIASVLVFTAWGIHAQGSEDTTAPSVTATAAAPLGPRVADGMMTRERAEYRAARVSDVRYTLDITLDPALDHFAGTVEIAFALAGADADLTVDFAGGTIADLVVNGAPVADTYNGQFVTLPAVELVEGPNVVAMSYTRPWTNDGTGLYRYDDPTDGRVYVYTHLEHWNAHLLLPCFDQLDLKGRFQFTVHAPEDWTVITTTRESSIEPGPDGTRTWRFPATPPMSTYILSLHAGPWAVWEDRAFRYPLRVLSRQELAEHMDPELWFSLTRRAFDVLEPYYGVKYPYKKYDQVVVPDLNAGAMENIAAVTFNESFVQRDGRDRDEELGLALVIGHEMAHMWFGNLVTMRWWNGLWLKESFAEYMGYFVAERIGYPEAWEVFFRGLKQEAYDTDRRVTTHAVETPVATTDEVYDNWDAISYEKGASVLRQATFLLGEEAFRDGIRLYLPRHAEGNTGVDDFLAALSEASERDLRQWAREWLFTPGVNTLTAEYSCVNGRVDSFSLVQGAPADHPALRSQRVQVGFFEEVDGSVVTSGVMPVTYAGKRTGVPAAVGKPCPTLVYPNLGDHGYVIVELDPRTRANLTRSIDDIRDSFPRMMFWATLLDAARLGVLPIPEYLDAVLGAGRAESDRVAIEQIYGGAVESLRALRSMGEAAADAHTHYAPRIETMLWERLVEAEPETQSLFFDLYLRATSTKEGLARHVALLDDELMVSGLSVEDRRWWMLAALSKAGRPDALARARAELERDDSARGRRAMIAIESLYPDAATKEERLDALFDRESEMTLADMGVTAGNLFRPGQEKLHDQFARRIIAELSAIEARAEPGTLRRARLLARTLTPATCTEASVERLAKMVEDHKHSREPIRRAITEKWEDDVRCVARARALEGSETGP